MHSITNVHMELLHHILSLCLFHLLIAYGDYCLWLNVYKTQECKGSSKPE